MSMLYVCIEVEMPCFWEKLPCGTRDSVVHDDDTTGPKEQITMFLSWAENIQTRRPLTH